MKTSTAEKIIDQLHPRGEKKNAQGLALLTKYTNVVPATGKISRQIAVKTKKAKPLITKVDRKNEDRALSSLVFHINTDTLVHPPEIVRTNVVVEEVKAMMKRKKSMKMHVGSRFEVCRLLKYDEDGNPFLSPNARIVRETDKDGHEVEFEVREDSPYSMKTVSVQSHILIDTLNEQADKLDNLLTALAKGGRSEWSLFRVLTIFVKGFTVKPVRASS